MVVDVSEMHHIMIQCWKDVYALYRDEQEPAWAAFADRYGHLFPELPMPQLEPITANDLLTYFNHRGWNKSSGLDGWRTGEVKDLPASICHFAAATLNVCEAQGSWPESFCFLAQPALAKGTGEGPMDCRLLGLESVWLAAWSTIRFRQLEEWRQQWLLPQQMGAVRGKGIWDVTWPLQLWLEERAYVGAPAAGIMLDRTKCFDRIAHQIIFGLQEAHRCPTSITRLRRDHYERVQRTIKLNNTFGPLWTGTNAVTQGNVFSIDDISMLMSIWIRSHLTRIPRALVATFLDDSNVASESISDLEVSIDITMEFDLATDQRVNADKTAGWANNAEDAARLGALLIYDQRVPIVGGTPPRRRLCPCRGGGVAGPG